MTLDELNIASHKLASELIGDRSHLRFTRWKGDDRTPGLVAQWIDYRDRDHCYYVNLPSLHYGWFEPGGDMAIGSMRIDISHDWSQIAAMIKCGFELLLELPQVVNVQR